MEELVFIQDNERAITTSLLIAERFGKRHDHVLRAIQNLDCSGAFRAPNFGETEYSDKQGRKKPMYLITRDGFSFLVMGFTGAEAAKHKEEYITAFNQMEKLLLSDAYILKRADQIKDRMILALKGEVEQHKETIKLQAVELKSVAPKAEYYDKVLQAENAITTTIIAKELGMSAIKLNRILFEHGVQYQQSGHWVLYSKYDGRGYTKTRTYQYVNRDGEICASIQTEWTQAGREFIHRVVRHWQTKKGDQITSESI